MSILVRVTPVEELILLTLHQNELYGLEIVKALEECSDRNIAMSTGTLYPTLKKLTAKGLLQSRWGNDADTARRRYYRLTQDGVDALKAFQLFRMNLVSWQPQ